MTYVDSILPWIHLNCHYLSPLFITTIYHKARTRSGTVRRSELLDFILSLMYVVSVKNKVPSCTVPKHIYSLC